MQGDFCNKMFHVECILHRLQKQPINDNDIHRGLQIGKKIDDNQLIIQFWKSQDYGESRKQYAIVQYAILTTN